MQRWCNFGIMRKNGIIVILLLAFTQCVMASVVTPEDAARYAGKFMGMSSTPVADNVGLQRSASRGGAQEPEYYVFNNPDGGWVIIAADDRITPVLAYSESGSFDCDADMPDNLSSWINEVSQTVNAVRGSDEVASARVSAAWSVLRGSGTGPEGTKKEIETAKWDQGDPYNILCPIVTGETKRSVTGCIATAMAIVMRHNKWPEKGKNTIGGYTTSRFYKVSSYSIDDRVYDWSKMPLTDGAQTGWTAEQKQQVAQLNYDCGVMVKMDYSSKESYAKFFDVPVAMQEHMSYSDKILLVVRASYPVDEWFSIIKNEIDANRVVIYSATGTVGGHAMVCDGYDTDGCKLHMNWGWGGSANGYYTFDLSGVNTNNNKNLSFGENHMAIIGIAPDTSVVSHNETSQLFHYANSTYYGLTPSRTQDVFLQDMVDGTALRFKLGWFLNYSNSSVTKDFKVCLMDSSGTIIRQDGWLGRLKVPAANELGYPEETQTSKLTVTPELTDYFKLFFKEGSKWVPAIPNYELFPDADGICCGVTPDPIIILPEECSVGQVIQLKLTYGYVPVKTIKWSINGREYNATSLVLGSGTTEIRADVTYYDDSEGTITATLIVE